MRRRRKRGRGKGRSRPKRRHEWIGGVRVTVNALAMHTTKPRRTNLSGPSLLRRHRNASRRQERFQFGDPCLGGATGRCFFPAGLCFLLTSRCFTPAGRRLLTVCEEHSTGGRIVQTQCLPTAAQIQPERLAPHPPPSRPLPAPAPSARTRSRANASPAAAVSGTLPSGRKESIRSHPTVRTTHACAPGHRAACSATSPPARSPAPSAPPIACTCPANPPSRNSSFTAPTTTNTSGTTDARGFPSS